MRSAQLDGEVLAFLAERGRRTADEFGKDFDSERLPLLDWGDQPEFRAGSAEGRPTIFVSRHGPDWWRIRYQVAHEVFHWLCSPPVTAHWAHELFAVEMAVRALEEIGEFDYAATVMDSLTLEAASLDVVEMLISEPADGFLEGLYGRAWLSGRQLADGIGWERLKPLASCFDGHGKPDVVGWVGLLEPLERTAVEAVLGQPSSRWV